jgi:hypothetical protein
MTDWDQESKGWQAALAEIAEHRATRRWLVFWRSLAWAGVAYAIVDVAQRMGWL